MLSEYITHNVVGRKDTDRMARCEAIAMCLPLSEATWLMVAQGRSCQSVQVLAWCKARIELPSKSTVMQVRPRAGHAYLRCGTAKTGSDAMGLFLKGVEGSLFFQLPAFAVRTRWS